MNTNSWGVYIQEIVEQGLELYLVVISQDTKV